MLIITNRKVESDQTGGEAFSSKFSKNDTKLTIADAFNASADLEAPISKRMRPTRKLRSASLSMLKMPPAKAARFCSTYMATITTTQKH
jgi:hypothetical protein